jgi:hypothetical protein
LTLGTTAACPAPLPVSPVAPVNPVNPVNPVAPVSPHRVATSSGELLPTGSVLGPAP